MPKHATQINVPCGRTHSFSARFSAAALSLIVDMPAQKYVPNRNLGRVSAHQTPEYVEHAVVRAWQEALFLGCSCRFKGWPLDGTNGPVTLLACIYMFNVS